MADLVRPRPAFGRALRGREAAFNILVVHVRNMAVETNSQHSLVTFIFFVLLGFLQIKYPDNPTPFQVHPKTMLVSIACFLAYCLVFWIRLKFAVRVTHFDTLMEVFGSLSLISLVLMLLPDTWESSGYIIYTLWFVSHLLTIIRPRFIVTWRERPLLPHTSMDLN